MIIENAPTFLGQHCETTATGSLLAHIDISLSEPMLFGLGEGLSFIYWNMKGLDFPFLGGRVKPGIITKNLATNLNLELEVKVTSSIKKAWKNVCDCIQKGILVGLQLDCYPLEYFTNKIHFAGHFVAIYGYDEEFAHLIDTQQQGGKVRTTLRSLEEARNAKGPMAAKNLMYTLQSGKGGYDLKKTIVKAIRNNAKEYLDPPIKNIAYKGIEKTSAEIKKWFKRSKNIESEFKTSAMLMEKAGTGGALFRNLYRDFLKESYELTRIKEIQDSYGEFIVIAEQWTNVAALFEKTGDTKDFVYIEEASEILREISAAEYSAINRLRDLRF